MTTREVLQAARDYISDVEHWCQDAMKYEDRVCSLGAIYEITKRQQHSGRAYREAVSRLADVLPPKVLKLSHAAMALEGVMGGSVAVYNDTHSHECVLAAFDAAIEKADRDECSAQP